MTPDTPPQPELITMDPTPRAGVDLPSEFFRAWCTVATSHAPALEREWTNLKSYTSRVLGKDDCILVEVATQMGLRCYPHDYYHTDGVLFTASDLTPGRPDHERWFRGLTVAFEHEHNYDRNLFQEVSHLLILNARLRVLVTYPPPDKQDILNYLKNIIDECPAAKDIERTRSFLLILGYRDPLRWEGLLYGSRGWQSL